MQKDIGYIRESLTKIDTTMAIFDRNFARKEEIIVLTETLKNFSSKLETKADHTDVKNMIEILKTKVDHHDFDPIKKTLSRINWLIIAAIVGALLGLVIQTGVKSNQQKAVQGSANFELG